MSLFKPFQFNCYYSAYKVKYWKAYKHYIFIGQKNLDIANFNAGCDTSNKWAWFYIFDVMILTYIEEDCSIIKMRPGSIGNTRNMLKIFCHMMHTKTNTKYIYIAIVTGPICCS